MFDVSETLGSAACWSQQPTNTLLGFDSKSVLRFSKLLVQCDLYDAQPDNVDRGASPDPWSSAIDWAEGEVGGQLDG